MEEVAEVVEATDVVAKQIDDLAGRGLRESRLVESQYFFVN